jgi:hypothetical protein
VFLFDDELLLEAAGKTLEAYERSSAAAAD